MTSEEIRQLILEGIDKSDNRDFLLEIRGRAYDRLRQLKGREVKG